MMTSGAWVLVCVAAVLLAVQLYAVLHALRHLLGADELPALRLANAPMLSVVVPVRNESGALPRLLSDLSQQDYPPDRFEVIVVDDGSDDGTASAARPHLRSDWRVLPLLGGEGKKAAIELAVEHARGELVVALDADARCGPLRLSAIARAWQQAPFDMLLMPIRVRSNGSWLQELQANEQAGFMAVAIASARAGVPLIANGANMAFRRSTFELLGGYDGDRHIASGDDMFLLRKMRSANKQVTCLATADAVVSVAAATSTGAFLDQRKRWAGKMKAMGAGAMAWWPFLAIALPLLLWICSFAPFVDQIGQGVRENWIVPALVPVTVPILLWLAWLVPLVTLITATNTMLHRRPSPFSVAMDLMLFSLYAPAIAVLSLFKGAQWKGRRV